MLSDNTFDFVILNHVIEHVANPINAIKEIFRVTRGLVVISAPDKHFTFDKQRQLTPFDHLMTEGFCQWIKDPASWSNTILD